MKLSDVLKDINCIAVSADPDMEIGGVCYDSRKVRPGDLFVAIRGFSTDGHRYIPKAVEMGAGAVLCERAPEEGIPYVLTDDGRLALALASRNFYADPARKMTVIGITGTSGKTTSSYLIKHMLESALDAKVGLIGTNGHMIGDRMIHSDFTTPESLELQKLFKKMSDEGCSHVVMEVSSHSLALERVAGIRFDVALYTNLSRDHLDFHKTMEEYAAAKRKILGSCSAACINIDDAWAPFMTQNIRCPYIGYSAEKEADLTASGIELTPSGVTFSAAFRGRSETVHLRIPGMFSVYNALGVIAAGLSLGISLKDCASALCSAHGVKGRLENVPVNGNYSVIIDYSHKPDALENVLKTLRPVTKGKLIVVFGCGGDRDRTKRPVMGKIASENADVCIVTSDNPRTEDPESIIDEIFTGIDPAAPGVIRICDRAEAIGAALDSASDGDVILLAGKGHEDYQIVGHEKRHMDEREIIAACLKKREQA